MRAHGVEVVFTKPVPLQSELCNLKTPKDKLQRKDVAYKVDCGECGVSCIWETAQWFTGIGQSNISIACGLRTVVAFEVY